MSMNDLQNDFIFNYKTIIKIIIESISWIRNYLLLLPSI